MRPNERIIFAVALVVVVLTGCALLREVWRRRTMPCARSFLVMVLGGTIWALGDALKLVAGGEAWLLVSYVGIGALPVGWLAFCLEYTGRGGFLTRRTVVLVSLIPALTVPVVGTSGLHHWMWESVRWEGGVRVNYGVWHLVSAGYSYLLFIWGFVVLLLNLGESAGSHRRRVLVLLAAGLAPWAANLLQILDVYPRSAPNPTPLAFVVSSIVFFVGLFRLQLLEIVPVAHRVVIGQMRDALVVLEAQDRVVGLNPAAEVLLGLAARPALGRPLGEVLAQWPELAELATCGDSVQREIGRERAGAWEYFDVQGSVLRDDRGRRLGRFFLVRDITAKKVRSLERERLLGQVQHTNERLQREIAERQKAESALKRSEEIWHTFCEHTHTGIYRTTPDGRILMANPALVRMLGFDSFEQLSSRNLEQEHYEPRYDRRRFKEALDRDGRIVAWETPWLRRDGTKLWVRESAQAVLDAAGVIQFYDGTIEDISGEKSAEDERRKLELEMQQIQKLESLGVLAGGIAHDFNNLLMVILGNTDLALDEIPLEAPLQEPLREIRRTAVRAADLCRQMLAYAGRGRYEVEPLWLPTVLENTASLLRSSVSKKAILRLAHEPDTPWLRGDATQIRQLIVNLVVNASEALGEKGGEIAVSAGAATFTRAQLQSFYLGEDLDPGPVAWLEVADTGCGMDATTRERIFEPFFTTKFTGRGLGLPAVLGIVRGHHGALSVESEVGRGTTVRVLFPAALDRSPDAGATPARPPAAGIPPGAVLLVDDEDAVRRVGRKLLEAAGHAVVTARDGAEALAIYREQGSGLALVLLDFSMPQLDGRETLEQLRRLNPQVRVIAMSGHGAAQITERFRADAGVVVLEKPFAREALLRAVQAALS